MKDLWPLLLSAQENIAGIPSAFLEQKKEEIRQRQVSIPPSQKVWRNVSLEITLMGHWWEDVFVVAHNCKSDNVLEQGVHLITQGRVVKYPYLNNLT